MKTYIELGIDSMNYTGTLTAAQKDAVLSELKNERDFRSTAATTLRSAITTVRTALPTKG